MIKIFADAEQLNRFAAEKFVEIANDSIDSFGKFTVALSGGSTPKALYQSLSSDKYKSKIDWSKVFFFFGDERNVASDEEESNYRMARENFLAPLRIPETNIFRWKTEIKDANKIAEDYENAAKKFFTINDNEFPKFDLIFLGMGDDGHTASLFPYTKAVKESKRIAVANAVEKLAVTRLTLTFPVINNASNVIFLIKGADKAESLREVLQGEFQPEKLPAQSVKLNDGNIFWLIEKQAAQLLT